MTTNWSLTDHLLTIHCPLTDHSLTIHPANPVDIYYVYLKYDGFPNETYYDWVIGPSEWSFRITLASRTDPDVVGRDVKVPREQTGRESKVIASRSRASNRVDSVLRPGLWCPLLTGGQISVSAGLRGFVSFKRR